MKHLRRAALWLVLHGPRLPGPLAPWLFGVAIGSKPHAERNEQS